MSIYELWVKTTAGTSHDKRMIKTMSKVNKERFPEIQENLQFHSFQIKYESTSYQLTFSSYKQSK